MRLPPLRHWPFRRALLLTIPVMLIVAAATFGGNALESVDRSIFDWRTAVLGHRLKGPYPGLAVIRIDEASVAERACRSPLDRAMLAELIDKIAAAGARVIAIDYLFDQQTTPAADAALATTLTKVNTPIVLAAYDRRTRATPQQRARQGDMLKKFAKPVGYVTITREFDGRVRAPAKPEANSPFPVSFTQQIAKAAGISTPPLPERIAWLIPPRSGETFLTFPASGLLGRESTGPILSRLKGRIVLIGGDLFNQNDSYLTPLSTIKADGYERMPGVLINAHMVAQLLDGRDYRVLGKSYGIALAIISAFLGVLYGWYFQNWRGPVNLPPIMLFLALDAAFFWAARIIIPFAIPALAWLIGAWLGNWLVKKEVGDEDMAV